MKGKPGFSLAIATPFYEVKGYSPYISSFVRTLMVLAQTGIDHGFIERNGDSYVDRAKNGLIDDFLKTDFSHILMIDSDLEWDVEGFGRLLKAALSGAEVVGGAFRLKGDWGIFGINHIIKDGGYAGKEFGDSRLLRVTSLPGGFIIYSRDAIERTRPLLNTYDMGHPVLECFRCEIDENHQRLGEDIYFQRKYMEAGGKLYLEPNINITHYGVKGYGGNYHRHLQEIRGGVQHNQLIKNLANAYKGETAWIVGKGPSLLNIKKEDFGDGPIICISEAIIPVEKLGLDNPIYSLQKDADPPDRPPIQPPKSATLLIQEVETPDRHREYKPRFVFDNSRDFGCVWNTISSVSATNIAELMGCTEVAYVSFDACQEGQYGVVEHNPDGTHEIIERDNKAEYRTHFLALVEHNRKIGMPFKWVLPKPQGVNNGTKKQAVTT